MQFTTLKIENFLAITSADISLRDRGLVLVQGVNNADSSANSNGAGKSSIADALCWCWFGTTARDVSGDDVVNEIVGKNTSVASTIIDGSVTYTATRHRKHKTGKNSLTITMHNGLTETVLTKGTDKLTQEIANQIIGSSLEVFIGSIYAGQEKMPDLPAMPDKQLKMLIEEAAGVTVLEAAYKRARDDFAAQTLVVNACLAATTRIAEKIGDLESQIAQTKLDADKWKHDQSLKIAVLKSEAADVVVPALKAKIAEVIAVNEYTISDGIAKCDAAIGAVGAETVKMATLERALTIAESRLDSAMRRLSLAEKSLDAASEAARLIMHKVGCPCTECGRPLTEAELITAEKVAGDRETKAATEYGDAVSDQEGAQLLHTSALQERDDFKLRLTDISKVSAQRAALMLQKSNYDTLVRERDTLMTKAKGLKLEIETCIAEQSPILPLLKRQQEQLVVVSDGQASLEENLKVAREKLDVETEVVRVFSPAGVRARVLDEITPFLNNQTAKYLTTMSDGNINAIWSTLTPGAKKGEFKEKFSIDVSSMTGGKTFKGLSGGEKRKVRISTALALQDLVATRASKPIDLFIGDEIDDALDPAGLERLMVILDEKAKERGSVFVISHNDLADHISQVMIVEKSATGETTITEVTM